MILSVCSHTILFVSLFFFILHKANIIVKKEKKIQIKVCLALNENSLDLATCWFFEYSVFETNDDDDEKKPWHVIYQLQPLCVCVCVLKELWGFCCCCCFVVFCLCFLAPDIKYYISNNEQFCQSS